MDHEKTEKIINHEKHEIHEPSEIYGKEGKKEILYEAESFAIQGAIFNVYREMGCGFLEAVYQECLEKEFTRLKIPFKSQVEIVLSYKGERLNQTYKADFVCYGKIIVELKAVIETDMSHRAQILNYLKATGMRLGLLVNIGHFPMATVERFVS